MKTSLLTPKGAPRRVLATELPLVARRNIDWRATCRETVTAMRAAYASGKGISLSREQLHSLLCGYAL